MSLIDLLSLISKLVNEHGSSGVLQQRIALIKEGISKVEKDREALAAENIILRKECERYKANNLILEKKNAELQIELDGLKQDFHDRPLSDIEKAILLYVAKDPARNASQIAEGMQLKEPLIAFHAEEMRVKGLIESERVFELGDCWSLTHSGRGYLLENGLL